jgi:hypothetical protein
MAGVTSKPAGPALEWPLLISGLVGFAGLVLAVLDQWRPGVLLFSGGILLAGVFRLVLSDDQAGLLRVRRRPFDTVMMLGMGIAVLVLALIVPS